MPRTVSQKENETLNGIGLKNESCDEKTMKTETSQDRPEDVKSGQVHFNISRQKQGILLLDHREKLQVESEQDFSEKLDCPEDETLKVVSIFGNTGDGKSHTLNHTFFDGKEVFCTSQAQVSCTIGIWAAYDDKNHLLILDTEGLLSTANDSHQRKRLLMKILAISDVIVYRTRAERLHSDMFRFIGHASGAYLKHFTPALKAALKRGQLQVSLCSLGPAVVIFHETQFTDILGTNTSNSGDFQECKSADELLKERFADTGQLPQAFSSIKYVGTKTSNNASTDFSPLFETVLDLTNDTSVRSRRGIAVIYDVLNLLNEKFSGDIDHVVASTFPDSYFTCSTLCQSCNTRCQETMNHVREGVPHKSSNCCVYQAQFDNRYFTCKACYERGKTNCVIPKAFASGDGSLLGLAKYAWSGYVLQCSECGIIYRSRQYWYGNTDPVKTIVRTELNHVWLGENSGFVDGSHPGRRVLDGLNSLTRTVGTASEVPSRYVKDWLAGAIAPSYWVPNSEIKKCRNCAHVFESHESKHHCRACGEGFCDECSAYKKPVPDKGWGNVPVKVCQNCYHESPTTPESAVVEGEMDTSALSDALDEVEPVGEKQESLVAWKVGKVFNNSMSKLAVVVDFPRELINDAARPSYWAADADIVNCFCCDKTFRVVDTKHHCRACGQGVCEGCSGERRPVPARGWDYPVRVCRKCVAEMP